MSLHCNSSSPPLWFWGENKPPRNAALLKETNPNLKILNVQLNNSGRYSCYGTSDRQNKFTFVASSKVRVMGENTIFI